jgi:hypothetical protein
MRNLYDRFGRSNRVVAILTLILVFTLSSIAFAAPDEKHGRGPVGVNYRDRDDDDERRGGWDWNRRELRRRAMNFGSSAGFRAGRQDKFRDQRFNFRDEHLFRMATLGYRRNLGSIDMYRRIFREAFAESYARGYRSVISRW